MAMMMKMKMKRNDINKQYQWHINNVNGVIMKGRHKWRRENQWHQAAMKKWSMMAIFEMIMTMNNEIMMKYVSAAMQWNNDNGIMMAYY